MRETDIPLDSGGFEERCFYETTRAFGSQNCLMCFPVGPLKLSELTEIIREMKQDRVDPDDEYSLRSKTDRSENYFEHDSFL